MTGKLTKALGSDPQPFAQAIEIGAGTGYFSLNLMRAGLIEKLTATDISQGMLDRLAKTATGLDLDVECVACDAEQLPFADRTFDLVLGHAVLHHLPDLEQAFTEFCRVLKPGGTLFFCGEPSRYGDRLATVPKRTGALLAPLWRRRPAAGAAALVLLLTTHLGGGAAPTMHFLIRTPLLTMGLAFVLLFVTLQVAAMRNEILRQCVYAGRLAQAAASAGQGCR